MKTIIEKIACAVAMSIVLLACNDTGVNDTEQTPVQEAKIPNGIAMNSRVVSYKRDIINTEYIMQQLGNEWYNNGFITDKEILKLWFPHIFKDEQTESKCNYVALHFIGSSSGLVRSYEILSQDMVLYRVGCTWREPPGGTSADFVKRAMLICDDKDWKLKESINLDSLQFIQDPNWECESGEGGPNWEEIYF